MDLLILQHGTLLILLAIAAVVIAAVWLAVSLHFAANTTQKIARTRLEEVRSRR